MNKLIVVIFKTFQCTISETKSRIYNHNISPNPEIIDYFSSTSSALYFLSSLTGYFTKLPSTNTFIAFYRSLSKNNNLSIFLYISITPLFLLSSALSCSILTRLYINNSFSALHFYTANFSIISRL